jgi:hypothetical protein
MATKHYGLLLTLGGAPDVPHTIPGVTGFVSPSVPLNIEDAGLTVTEARELAKDSGGAFKVVEIKPGQLHKTEDFQHEVEAENRNEQSEDHASEDSTDNNQEA